MDFLQMLLWFNWNSIKNKLIQMGIPETEMKEVNFNDMNSLNQFAERIVPMMLKSNPNMKNFVKQNSSFFWNRKDEVIDIVDKL